MTLNADIQKLQPGKWVELHTFDGTEIGAGILRFHSYTQIGTIWWQGNEFYPWPVEATGFSVTSDQQPNPKFGVANLNGSISLLCHFYEDMVGAKVVRHRTLAKYMDAANFGGVNPDADPDEHVPDDIWYVERKLSEDAESVVFELSTGMDFLNQKIPNRQIIANHCTWTYRSTECGYTGGAVAKADDTATADLALDRCSKKTTGCKLRYGANNPLSTGAFPAADLMR